MIEFKNISKTYKVAVREGGIKNAMKSLFTRNYKIIHALNDVSFQIAEGEMVGYIGPNGAGKSTTIKIMCGILTPDSGQCVIDGRIPYKERVAHVQQIGVVFGQRSQLWWDLPVKDSFYVNGSIYGMSKKQVDDRLLFFMRWLELDYLDVPVRKLSLGRRVMCDILISMLHSPEILFLDEATIALDVFNRKKILEMISRINKELGTTLIITSHQLDDIETVCDRILLLNEGKLFYDGLLNNFLKNSQIKKVVSVQTKDLEKFKKELELIIDKNSIQISYKGSEVNLFLEREETYEKIIQFLPISQNVDTFSIRGITLEERLLLMEG